MELCDLQADSFMHGKRHLDSEELWRLVSDDKYPKLNDFALRFCSLMGSTCVGGVAQWLAEFVNERS